MVEVKESLLTRDAFIFQKSKIMESIACILDNTTTTPSDEPLPHHTQGSDWKPIDEEEADMLWQLHCDVSITPGDSTLQDKSDTAPAI